jgi:formylglycine-generating enzyme
MSMKQLSLKISAVALVALAASCGQSGSGGQLVGSPNLSAYRAPVPVGMVYVPSGILKMGASDQDVRGKNDALIRTTQMTGFYMDATEISNAEYRQFTNWVRDSMAHTTLGDFKDMPDGTQVLDMSKKINWKDPDVQDQLSALYVPADQTGWGKKEMDNSKLLYHYSNYDYSEHIKNSGQPAKNYIKETTIAVYPDTTVWVRQFSYSYNEPIARQYNWFGAFDNYPVVGVTWKQANAFSNWRTDEWKKDREKNKMYFEGQFMLPNEMQWEWAARGGRNASPYPWGGPYILNKKGCYLANFKPQRGNYAADGGLYTVPVNKYWPNDYGLYNMSGNVAEWTASPYYGNTYNQIADVNPNLELHGKSSDPQWLQRKVVRGGSWRDVSYYLQVSTRDYEYADTAKSYIGFRNIFQQIVPALTNRR